MYKNRKYRSGTASLLRQPAASPSSSSSNQALIASTLSAAPATSVAQPAEPIPSTSNSSSAVLREQNQNIHNNDDEELFFEKSQTPDRPTMHNPPRPDSPSEVPASQFIAPSRYISQRSIRMRSQMSQVTQRTPRSYFDNIIERSGVKPGESDNNYTIYCDHSKFVSRVRKELKAHTKYPENVQSFLSGLQELMKSQMQLTKLLSGCIISLPNSDLSKPSQESLMRDFLMIDFLQVDMIEILLNKVKSLSVDEHPTHMTIELLLSQLKFVDHLANGDLVCERIFEILEMATENARQTIMRSLEDIIDLTRHNDVVKKLMEILPNDADLLTEATIDSFGNMCLSGEMHAEICHKIICYIKTGAPMELLPTFTKFILRFNSKELNILPTIIEDLRMALKWPLADLPTTKSAIHANQKTVFNCISRYLLRSKDLYEIWLKIIQRKSDGQHKPIDLVVLLMMMTIKEDRSGYIEKIILRRKIRTGEIQLELLEDTIHMYPTVLLEYTKILFELLGIFIHDKNVLVSNFASAAYRLVFGIENCDHKLLLSKLIAFVYEKRTQVASSSVDKVFNSPTLSAGGGVTDMTTHALMILSDINERYPNEMKKNGLQLMLILDRTEDFTLTQFRLIMEILCLMAYRDPPCEALKTQLDMMVKKQVSSSIKSVKNRGIVGLIRVVDHMVWNRCEENVANLSGLSDLDRSISIEDLPTSSIKAAGHYIDLLITSSLNCPNYLALSFDELSAMILARNKHVSESGSDSAGTAFSFNRPFLLWLCDTVKVIFQDSFVIYEESRTMDGLELSCAYGLNALSEIETESGGKLSVAIDIAGAVLRPTVSSKTSVIILSPVFKLTRIVHAAYSSGSLSEIDAILGASIVLPTNIINETDLFDEFDEKRAKQMLDIYFHLVNFWRECISAFANQIDKSIRKKVLTRLTEVIKLEAKIKEILQTAPDDYQPPVSNFSASPRSVRNKFKRPIAVARKGPRSRKTANINTNLATPITEAVEDITMTETGGLITQNRTTRKKPELKTYYDFSYGPMEIYRQMDPIIMLLFEEQLVLEFPLSQEKIGHVLGLLEFKFLIQDLTLKIESLFGVQKFGLDERQCIHRPSHFIYDIVQILPKIMNFFEQLANQLRAIVNNNVEGGEDADYGDINPNMFTEETNYIKTCFGLCLRLLAVLYTWPGFTEVPNRELLTGSFRAIIGDHHEFDNPQSQQDTHELALAGIKKMIENCDIVSDLRSAVYMFHLVQSLVKYVNGDDAYKMYVVKLSEKFLSRVWYAFDGSEERGNEYNSLLDDLLKGYFKNANFDFIRSNAEWIYNEISNSEGNHGRLLKTFPCFKIANFPLIFRIMYSSLIEALHLKIDHTQLSPGQLKIWEVSCSIINILLEIVKLMNTTRVHTSFVKHSHAYIKVFLLHGIRVIESCLRMNIKRVVDFLHSLQNSTRYLHTLCVHSKKITNSAIINQIPTLRETVTQLLYKVKGALAANKCSTAFWTGNLKNKDIDGDLVLSQATSLTQSTSTGNGADEDGDDELPSEEDDENADVEGNTTESTNSKKGSKKRQLGQKANRETTSELSDSEDTLNSSRSKCF